MIKPSCPLMAARTADEPASAALTRGEAWREDAAGDIRSRITEVTPPPQHHPAANAVWLASVVNALMTSAKGDVGKVADMNHFTFF